MYQFYMCNIQKNIKISLSTTKLKLLSDYQRKSNKSQSRDRPPAIPKSLD